MRLGCGILVDRDHAHVPPVTGCPGVDSGHVSSLEISADVYGYTENTRGHPRRYDEGRGETIESFGAHDVHG
jgi:hypothetical protein